MHCTMLLHYCTFTMVTDKFAFLIALISPGHDDDDDGSDLQPFSLKGTVRSSGPPLCKILPVAN